MSAFEVGDVVELKTGGIHMIVKEIIGGGLVQVVWDTEENFKQIRHEETYDERMLKKVPNQEEGGGVLGDEGLQF